MSSDTTYQSPAQDAQNWLPADSYAYFRALYRRLLAQSTAERPVRAVGVTSCQRGAGVSTVALNLALVATHAGRQSVLLLDLSTVRSSLAGTFRVSGTMGLRDALSGAARPAACAQATPLPNLSLLGANEGRDSLPLELTYEHIDELLRALGQDFDFIVVDLPPTESSICFGAAGLLDGVLLVIESQCTQAEAAAHGKRQLIGAVANLLGVVLNKHK